MVDDSSKMEIVSNETAYIDESFAYFSLLNIFGFAKDITIENAQYPLDTVQIACEYQCSISNKVLSGDICSK